MISMIKSSDSYCWKNTFEIVSLMSKCLLTELNVIRVNGKILDWEIIFHFESHYIQVFEPISCTYK